MNLFRSIIVVSLLGFAARAGAESQPLENLSPHLAKDAKIIWKTGSNSLPKSLWTYQKKPQHFSAATVSNAAVLGHFELKPLLRNYTKPLTIWDKTLEGDPRPDYFMIEPSMSLISFHRERRRVTEGDNGPDARIKRAWSYAILVGLDKALLSQPIIVNDSVSLPRKVEGIPFMDDAQGFSLTYGPHGEILSLAVNWPVLERQTQERVCGYEDIERCIRSFKTPVLPTNDEPNYFGRIKFLANTRTLTITNITPFYTEGRFGEQPNEAKPETFVGPVAVLDAIASWGPTNTSLKIAVPFIMADVTRLLKPDATRKP